jgi:hypothetical protein
VALAALAILTAMVIGAAIGARPVLVGLGGGPLATAESAVGRGPASAGRKVHVVEPGDSLWSIVRASGVRGDPRPVVDRLVRQLGGRPLQVGQRIFVP